MTNLSDIARRLNLAARAGHLPAVILMTDEVRLPDPVPMVARLSPGSAVLLRHYGVTGRAEIAEQLARICRARGLDLIIAADPSLAGRVGADGLHIPSWFAAAARRDVRQWKRKPGRYVTASVHGIRELHNAMRLGADLAIASPVFATDSHPFAHALGTQGLAALVGSARVPVYALGGISPGNVGRLAPTGVAGVAGIGGIVESNTKKGGPKTAL